MVIGFNPQFVLPILTRTKTHTVREDIHNRWKPGMKMHMATGVRTKQYSQFFESYCQCVQSVEIHFHNILLYNKVIVDNRELTFEEMKLFAKNDGFDDVCDFLFWFEDKAKNNVYKGKVIHWTDFKY